MKSCYIAPLAIKEWEKSRSILNMLFVLVRTDLLIALFASLVGGILQVVVRPLMLGFIISNLTNEKDTKHTLKLVGIMLALLLIEGFVTIAVRHAIVDIFGHSMVSGISSLIQNKLLKLPASSTTSSSLELGFVGNDLFRLKESLTYTCHSVLACTGLLGGIVLLVIKLGVASVPGIAVLLSILVANMVLGKLSANAEELDLKAADVRLAILKQMVGGIKAIKLCAWESSFLESILSARQVEMKFLQASRFYAQFSIQIGRACPIISAASCFLFLAVRGESFSAADLFSAFNVFLALRQAMIILPESVKVLAIFRISFRRIEMYLNLPEVELTPNIKADTLSVVGEYQWSGDSSPSSFKLRIPNKIQIPRHKSVAVISRVGGGKTTFLHALLRELKPLLSRCELSNPAAYTSFVPQNPIIFGATIKENITLSLKKDLSEEENGFLTSALYRSALITDIKLLRNGVLTVIGEKGINFSGGQQQRVAIAREVYHSLLHKDDTNGVLMVVDDSLAAVDVAVAEHLFREAFLQHLKENENNILVMALNQTKFLKYFDYVIELKDGIASDLLPVSESTLSQLDIFRSVIETVLRDQTPPEAEQTMITSSAVKEDDLYEADFKATGMVSFEIIKNWVGNVGQILFFSCYLSAVLTYTFMGFSDWWFTHWVDEVGLRSMNEQNHQQDILFVAVYASSCLCFLTFLMLTSSLFIFANIKGSKSLHKEAITKLLHCPISFFEKTPSGRILSRFTSDLSSVDFMLAVYTDNITQHFLTLTAQVVIVSILMPPILVVIVFAAVLYGLQVVAADRANRIVKREANLAMGPFQVVLSEYLDAKLICRQMKFEPYFVERFQNALDYWTRMSFCSLGIHNTSMLTSYCLSFIISGSSAFYIVLTDKLSPALAGLGMTYSFLIPYFLLNVGFQSNLLITGLNSLERIMDYTTKLPEEPPWYLPNESKIVSGEVEFKNVGLVYRVGLPPALNNLSFKIAAGEKVGIIGRTGAGKSSVVLLLLRIADPSEGQILIGSVNISSVGLMSLRKSISIIPQTPLLLKGNIQDNLTAFGKADFSTTKQALLDSGLLRSLPNFNNEIDIDSFTRTSLEINAESLSSGQKQLLSLARCLLNSRIHLLILDEPTSNVDLHTDKVVHEVVKTKFAGVTSIIIAHRLETLNDVNRIIVLEQGSVKRIAPPAEILNFEQIT